MSENLIFHKVADTGRYRKEGEELRLRRVREGLAFETSKKLLTLFADLHCDKAAVVSQTIDLTETEKGFDGKISYSLGTIHAGETKIVEIPVSFVDGNPQIPEKSVVESVLSSTEGDRKKTNAMLRKEVDDFIAAKSTILSVPISKTASSAPSAANVLAPVMNIEKTWLPCDVKVGDVLFVDGAKYRVTSGDHKKLASESSGCFWTLTLCYEHTDLKETPKHIIY